MKVGLPLYVPGALAGVADAARRAEDAGVDGVSCSELTVDPMLQLTVAAGATSRVELLSNIVVAFARSPMTLAVQARNVQDYSGGRLVLGLGSQVKPHIERRFSMPWGAPAVRMAEYVSALRAIWHSWDTGERLNFRGDFYQHTLMTPMFAPSSAFGPPPVYLAAVGERMTQTAGAVADGLLLHPFCTPRYLAEVSLPALALGRGERPVDAVDVVAATFVVSGRDDEEYADSRRRVCAQLAFYASTPAYLAVLAQHGWQDLGAELNRLSKAPDPDTWRRMGELITDDVLTEFAVIADPDDVGPALEAKYGSMITRYEVNPVGLPEPEVAVAVAQSVQRMAVAL